MERISPSLRKDYPPLKLYLEDLEEIAYILGETSKAEFKTRDYKFTNLEELAAKYRGQRLKDLEIKIREPYVHIALGKHFNYCYVHENSLTGAGIFYRIDQVLIGRSRSLISGFFLSFDTLPYFGFCLALMIGAAALILKRKENLNWPLFMSIISGASGLMVCSIWGMHVLSSLNSVILVKRKHEEQSFVTRNRDQLIIALFSAIVGAAVGALLTFWLALTAHSAN